MRRTLPDPYIWHRDSMVSTWKFHGSHGYFSRRAASLAWSRVFNEAVEDHHIDGLIGTHGRRWSAAFPDDGTVDVLLFPRPQMTWRMLAEGFQGAELVIFSGREFRFSITAEGAEEEVGYGETSRRKSLPQGRSLRGGEPKLATLPTVSSRGAFRA